MRYLLIALLLSGCSTVVPVTAKFPEKPSNVEACVQLDTVADDVKLSGLTSTVAKNYNSYYECAVKVDTWNEWYEKQKRIFEGVGK
jgi:alpha-L-arabinofuranosidase